MRPAAFSCTRKRPKWSTAGIAIERQSILQSSSRFSALRSGLVWLGIREGSSSPTSCLVVSPQALQRMRNRIKAIGLPSLVHFSIEEIARILNPVLRGWIQYYGRFYKTEMISKLYHYLDDRIASWLRQKYKKLRGHRLRGWRLLDRLRRQRSDLFAHWHRASVVVSG